MSKSLKTLAVGSFDGIHRGHRSVLQAALETDGEAGMLCFEPLPREYFGGSSWKRRLSTVDERNTILLKMGIPSAILLPFNENTVIQSPEEFLQRLPVDSDFRTLVVGYDFHFGYKRSGSISHLKRWCNTYRKKVIILPPLESGGIPIKSEWIRKLLETGKLQKANSLLGYSYFAMGVVERGKGVGRLLGFPTLNIRVSDSKLLPPPGSYLGAVRLRDTETPVPAALFVPPGRVGYLEAHLPGWSGSIYGSAVTAIFFEWLRGVEETTSKQVLSKYIELDVERVITHGTCLIEREVSDK